MDATKTIAALFDFDGVIMDTEPQYTIFWNEQGQKYLHKENFGPGIKGQTLAQIYDKYFSGDLVPVREQITRELNKFEKDMVYEYLPGVQGFLAGSSSSWCEDRSCHQFQRREDGECLSCSSRIQDTV